MEKDDVALSREGGESREMMILVFVGVEITALTGRVSLLTCLS